MLHSFLGQVDGCATFIYLSCRISNYYNEAGQYFYFGELKFSLQYN